VTFGSRQDSGGDPGSEVLAGIPLFEGFSTEELERTGGLGQRIDVPTGTVLVDQGDPGTFCYVVVSGSANVYTSGEYIATSGPGAMIGEMALIDNRPRTATVVAAEPMVLLRFDTLAFKALLDEMPKAAERVHAVLGARLER
jgi:CRP-like cAMP-binding protein